MAGFSSVDVSCVIAWSCAIERSSRRMILPLRVFGRLSPKRMSFGLAIGPIAKPRDIRFGDNLPKTRSGKIMRRLLRSIAKGEEITQDVSTLENPAILEQLKQTM